MAPPAVSVQLVGPDQKSISALLAKVKETGEVNSNIIDVVWKKGKISGNLRDLARRQISQECKFRNSYIAKGCVIDLLAAAAVEVPSREVGLSDAQAKKFLLSLVKTDIEAQGVLVRYKQSLVFLVDSASGENSQLDDAKQRYVSILRCLRVPFHHLKETDLAMQVNIFKKAVLAGTLPSPFSSLSYFEQLSSKPKKKKSKKEPNEITTFYKNINLPFYWDQQSKHFPRNGMKSILLEESQMTQDVERPQKGLVNRFFEKRGTAHDLFLLQFDRSIHSSAVIEILRDGVHIQGALYSLLGCSTSGLKKRKAVLIKGTNEDAHNERQKYGDFASIKTVSKQMSRFALLLTNVVCTDVRPSRILMERDVELESGTVNFTDGCGCISRDLAEALYKKTRSVLKRKSERHLPSVPSVFQIRFQGCKGVATVDSALAKGTLVLRPSMKKFETKSFPSICICDYSRPYSFGNLNRQYITLLSGLGVPDETFLTIQQEHFERIRNMTHDYDSALQILEWRNLANELIFDDGDVRDHLRRLKSLQSELIEEAVKLKILIPESRTLFGVAEPPKFEENGRRRGILEYGECLVRVTLKGGQNVSLQNQRVVVSKNPCYLLGDIRVLKAVSSYERPELAELERDLVDCIVFPIEGENSHSCEIAGSDLDGDKYFVCWDNRLIPPRVRPAYTYPGYDGKPRKGTASATELISYFSRQNTVSDLTGRVDSNYRAWADVKGATSCQCERLGQLFSRVVDSAKSGERIKIEESLIIPRENRLSPSATSKFVWQKLEHFANCFAESRLKTGDLLVGALNIESPGDNANIDLEDYIIEEKVNSDDFLFDLLKRDHLVMSEFTKFRLVMQHLEGDISNFFHSPFAPLVNFAYFKGTELGFALSHYNVPEGAIFNSLKYYSRITYMHTAFMNKFVAKDRVPWQLYWRGESVSGTHHFSRMLMHALRKNTDALLLLQLPDSVVIMLRFSHHMMKPSDKVKLFGNEQECLEQDLIGFIDVNAVFLSNHFGYVEEYTLEDTNYKIDISTKSLQLYRGQRGATFVHLKLALLEGVRHDAIEKLQISVDLTRFNRRILNGRRRHPLVRKSAVFDMELFVSNRSTLHATRPSKISHIDVLLEDGEDWKSDILSQMDAIKSDWEEEFQLYEEATAELLGVIKKDFIDLEDSSSSDPRHLLLSFMDEVIRPSHQLFACSDRISTSLKNSIESLTVKLVSATISLFDTEEKLTLILDLVPLLSDLDIAMPVECILHVPSEEEVVGSSSISFVHIIRRWDFWLALGCKREEVLAMLPAFVGKPADPLHKFVWKNANEQARILIHELREGSEDMRSSTSVSRLVNLRIDPRPQDTTGSQNQGKKTPIVTLYGIQSIPAGLRFATGQYVCLLKQPSGKKEISNNNDVPSNALAIENYDNDFPALGISSERSSNQQDPSDYESKHIGCCIGRVVSVVDAPLSIKVKLVPPSYSPGSSVPLLIKECLREDRDIYWELQMIPANVIAHERIMDSIALALEPEEDGNLYFKDELLNYLVASESDTFLFDLSYINLNGEDQAETSSGQKVLNSKQQEAVKKSIMNILSLVHGPPGTGKSTTILGIIEEILATESSHKILVCAETNLAVDNLALRLMQTCDKIIRVGSGEKVHDKLKSKHLEAIVRGRVSKNSAHVGDTEQDFYLSKHKKVMNEILCDAQVIFATVIGSGDPILKGHKFDTVVIDEASMSTEPSALCPLSHGCSRLVLVGDHKQLGPHACDSTCVSLFERLISEAESGIITLKPTMLNQQHRMHPKLCRFPSKTFYEGKLLTAPGIDKERLIPRVVFEGKSPVKFIAVENGKEQRMKSGSWYNEVEVGLVLDTVNKLIAEGGKDGIHAAGVTVLTPYRAQQTRIQVQLKNSWKGPDQPPEVCSIDGYQGRENEIIIFSAVRCGSSLGFCDDNRRINVLLTRAKCGLVVLGDRGTLMKSPIWNSWIKEYELSK